MKGNAAKGIFIGLILIVGVVLYFFKDNFSANKDSKKLFKTYVKTEATIVSQHSNGRIGKGASMIFTVQYKDDKGQQQTVEMNDNSFAGKNNGEKIVIYFNPADPRQVADEKEYDEIVN